MAHAEATRFISAAPRASRWRMRASYAQDALLICVTALFVYAHGSHALENNSWTSAFFAIDQGILVFLFLTRRRTNTTSTRVWDWFVAAIGGWISLAMRPHETGGTLADIGMVIQFVGVMLVILSLSSLGRSFGVVAANRGLKTGGMYNVVRHPIYMSHEITIVGFLLANMWWFNGIIFAVGITFQVLRIRAEERVLAETSDYASYRSRVRWRLVPGLY